MRDRARRLLASLAVVLALACPSRAPTERYDAGFRGPGRLVLIFEPADPEVPRAIVVHDADGARALPIEGPRFARWLSPHELLVSREVAADEPYGLPRTELLRVDVSSGRATRIAEPARYFDVEPDPSGERIALGLEVDDQGESDLLVLALDGPRSRPVAGRNQPLDRPRWSPDGASIVILQTIPDPDGADSETALSIAGQTVSWPRLFRVASDLSGPLTPLRDGDPGEALVPGGTLPLFWSARGIHARQRRGLVRCDPAGSGCTPTWRPDADKRVVDARGQGPDAALVLVRDHSQSSDLDLPRELHRVDLGRGEAELVYRTPVDLYIAEIDWIAAP